MPLPLPVTRQGAREPHQVVESCAESNFGLCRESFTAESRPVFHSRTLGTVGWGFSLLNLACAADCAGVRG